MNCGIIGLPQTGKKTIFEILTGLLASKAPTRDGIAYAMAQVRDPRVDTLTSIYKPKRTKYAEFEMALPPAIRPESNLNAAWMNPLRKVDALLHVVRAFKSEQVFHICETVNPIRDMELVENELILSDLAVVEMRLERLAKEKSKATNIQEREQAVLELCKPQLEDGRPLRVLTFNEEQEKLIRNLQLLTLKPLLIVFNTGEDLKKAEGELSSSASAYLEKQGASHVCLSAALESELRSLTPEERESFMAEMGTTEPAAHRLSRAMYATLGLISFFTVGPDEVRAWPLRRGAKAPEAAGRIHSDLERGFIRAETVAYEKLVEAGSEKKAHELNSYRLNGKDYEVQDGDVLEIRFSV